MDFIVGGQTFEVRQIDREHLDDVLHVYQLCEDFLALGPVPTASMEMVLKDIEISQSGQGVFCGIYNPDGRMIGIIDYVPGHYCGEPATGFLELLMIAAPFRGQGIGKAVVELIENEMKSAGVNRILSGVQVNNPQAIQFWQRNGYRIVSAPKLHADQTTAVDLQKDFV